LAAAGCATGVKRIPAGGEVTLDGKPLAQGSLLFSPDPGKGNALRVGCVGVVSGGKFNLVTTGMNSVDSGTGAPIGWFKVTYANPNEGTDQADPTIKVAAKYHQESSTPISVELTDPPPPGGYKIELKSK
jgi:hypothetical protein